MLPITSEESNWHASTSTELLDQLLLTEIAKLNLFETVTISESQLSKWSNGNPLRIEERLPNSLLLKLQKELACDAVLFTHLQSYRPYKPMVAGWKLHLIDLRLQSTLWAAEETFDASDLRTANAARAHSKNNTTEKRIFTDSDQILLSPRQFNQFTIASIFKSLPHR